jgi:hypothetical protein
MGWVALPLLLLVGTVAGRAGAVQLSGVVTNSLTSAPVEGVAVTLAPSVPGPIVSGVDGSYSADVPADTYTVTFTENSYTTQNQPGVVVSAAPVVLDVILVPKAPVLVSADLTGDAAPDAVVQATGTIEILDGSTLTSVAWTQEPGGVAVLIADADQQTADVTLPGDTVYKDELIKILAEPPADPAANLPPGVEIPPGEFHGGLQDRNQVVAVNPLMQEEAGHVALLLTVVTSSGSYTDTLDIHATLPWKVASGLQSVPIGRAVLLHAKDRPPGDTNPYDWTLIGPGGSSAELLDATTQDPWFTPDLTGKYTVKVTDPVTEEQVVIDVYAGTWVGVITGKDPGIDGLPLAADCTSLCHNDITKIAPDNFTPWRESGHAEIFTDNLNTSKYYSSACFQCHSVGYDPDPAVANGGFDDAADFQDFLDAGLINNVPVNPTDNWSTVVSDFPATARLANVQCENCHGPRSELATHGNEAVSVSLAATNCAQCHGEPLRHGRYQQWQLSGHADYSVALDEDKGTNASCARCHSANGFVAWQPILFDGNPANDTDSLPVSAMTWTIDEVHPQTCATCHDPHDPGSASGDPTNATVRIVGDTPLLMAGFTATDVGKAAICMTCHNSRRGLRNDETFPDFVGNASELARAPHPGVQADMLMGQNAYLVTVGNRGPHSNRDLSGKVADVCVDCHMEATPPPADLSYNQSGTNHTFWARKTICSTCHMDGRTAEDVQGPIMASLETLKADLEGAILDAMDAEIQQGNTIDLNKLGTVTDVSEITSLEFTGGSGRQAILVTLGAGDPIGPVSLNNVLVRDGGGTSLGSIYVRSDEALPKAGWNYLLIESDGTHGIHNAEFATQILDASIAAVEAIPEPGSIAAALAAFGALAGLGRRSRRLIARSSRR